MDTANPAKQILPYSCDKKKLFAMYLAQMTEQQIRLGINAIIEDSRKNLPQKKVKDLTRSKLIMHDELLEFVDTYGMPKGFCKP